MNESNAHLPKPSASTVNGHNSITSLDATISNVNGARSANADLLTETTQRHHPSSSNGNGVLVKTCKRCLGKGRVITNAGTGLTKECKCNTEINKL